MTISVENIIQIIAILFSGFAVWRSFKLVPFEKVKIESETTKTYAEAAEKAAQRAENAEARLDKQNLELDKLRQEFISLRDSTTKVVTELRDDLLKANKQIVELLLGVEQLLKQLTDKQMIPIWKPDEKETK
jgi:hypothetical protein